MIQKMRTILRTPAFLLLIGIGTMSAVAAQPQTAPLVVMNLAAHPDDEDGSTLAYYRHAKDAAAYSVIFTRGEGGQNEIGPELYEELGAVRTAETEQAARHLGTQVFFLNFKDFGFSKSAEETYERWGGEDDVTSQLVYLIRKLKPDVLFTNHDTVTVGQNRQHGHHQVVGLSAYRAFELASDSEYHPEQLEEDGIDLWQPKRLFRRLWSTDGSHDVAVPVGQVDPDERRSYAEMAGRALHEHASQGMDRFAEMVAAWDSTYFELYRSATDAPLSATDLAANLAPNRAAEPDVTYWIASNRIGPMPDQAIAVTDSIVVPGQRLRVRWTPTKMPERPIRLTFFGAADTSIVLREDSSPGAEIEISPSFKPTIPHKIYQYERLLSHPPLGYAVHNPRTGELQAAGYLSLDVAPPVHLETDAHVVRLSEGSNVIPFVAQVFDERLSELSIAAALSHDVTDVVLDQRQETFAVTPDQSLRETVSLSLPPGPAPGSYTVALSSVARASGSHSSEGLAESTSVTGAGGSNRSWGAVESPNVPRASKSTSLERDGSRPATASAFLRGEVFNVEVGEGLRVGVVESYDNTLDRALADLGVDHVMLDSVALAEARFDDLHTIIIDIRAYLVRRDLRMYNDLLLDWVGRGGHLIVNYQKTFEWNSDSSDPFVAGRNNPANFAPYPLQLGRERVTRETASVDVLMPQHPLFNTPNAIDGEVWEGWVQERGLYFPAVYDERYSELFSLNDPGEAPLTGSSLLADVGRGTYLYTALVWYRQLKEYHPGAYRMFANMISLPLVDDRRAGP